MAFGHWITPEGRCSKYRAQNASSLAAKAAVAWPKASDAASSRQSRDSPKGCSRRHVAFGDRQQAKGRYGQRPLR
jgi:hypothetical protein